MVNKGKRRRGVAHFVLGYKSFFYSQEHKRKPSRGVLASQFMVRKITINMRTHESLLV